MKPVIGLLGKKRAGKDTFAGVLTREAGFSRVAFADPLRDVAYELNPLVGRFFLAGRVEDWRLRDVVDTIGWEAAKDYVPEIRTTGLQGLGQAVRSVDADFWLRIALGRIEAAPGPVVVTDVRLQNEADAIHALGGLLVRIVRPGPPVVDEHPTETALDGFPADYHLYNDREVADLEAGARNLLARLFV